MPTFANHPGARHEAHQLPCPVPRHVHRRGDRVRLRRLARRHGGCRPGPVGAVVDADAVLSNAAGDRPGHERMRRGVRNAAAACRRSEEHTSELQSLMRISYAVFCLKKTKKQHILSLNTLTVTNKPHNYIPPIKTYTTTKYAAYTKNYTNTPHNTPLYITHNIT